MRGFQFLLSIFSLLIVGCSLAEDVTPPPALATAQLVSSVAEPTEERWIPTTKATIEHALTEPAREPSKTIRGESSPGTIRGRVINGTTGETVAAGIEVHLIGIDDQTPVLSESTTTDTRGEFTFEGLEIVPDRIFGAYAEYQDVEYFSEGRHFSDQVIDLQVIVYEATPETRAIHVDRLHVMFDFTVEGMLDVMEVWVLSNQGNRTIAPTEGQEGIEFILPSGFRDLRFFDEMATERRFLITGGGFYDRSPLRPTEGTEFVFSFTLPYERGLDFAQPMSYPVGATVILMPEEGPQVVANGLQDLGVRDIAGRRRRIYNLGSISAGDVVELRLSGGPSASGGKVTQIELIIGAAVFGAALIVAVVWWYRIGARDGAQALAMEKIPSDREGLLRAIASLDDDFDVGRIPEDEYHRRRQTLKQEIIDLMREAHD